MHRKDARMLELLGLVVVISGFAYGVHRLVATMAARAMRACADAATLLGLEPIELSRAQAAATFLPPDRAVHSDPNAFAGKVSGADVLIASFTHDSNTAMNGALIPITGTHTLLRQLADFVHAGAGCAFVYDDRCATLVAHHDPARIRDATRAAASLARALARALAEGAPLR